MTYIRNTLGNKFKDKCVLCEIGKASHEKDEENLIIARGENVFVVLNRYPYCNGHLMVTPYAHVCDLADLSDGALVDIWRFTQRSIETLRRAANPDGFNVGANFGRVAGAGIEDHMHIHVVPRWSGDTNYMPVLSDVKVISQALTDTWRELREHWK
ncbi:HIT domain-containing protein [candidate division WOR-3 bacterium]|uniref:HIT domain-containing protein n=1 Tax=candidate division WOR-3 bacterium TaxID=2052148 RepID=A0A9D5KCB1_UNCW3|nr:HIT domain-containing protein [candidate division WOR-3 bacterium]MBD3365554.1 HIT domain-containing protein [candidate division WOR-3 bacterium]